MYRERNFTFDTSNRLAQSLTVLVSRLWKIPVALIRVGGLVMCLLMSSTGIGATQKIHRDVH